MALTATNRHVRHLRTLCCGAPLVLKTSRLGTRFFAHLALGGCASGDESPEHLALKAAAIAAARAASWRAEAEVAGMTPDGQPWRADVLANRGTSRIAIEVQWSPQPDDETRRRQARYAVSGVRGLWLFRGGFAADPDVPAVRVRGTLAKGLTILDRPPAAFFAAVFDRRLRFGFPAGSVADAVVEGAVVRCWGDGCGAMARAVTRVDLSVGASACAVDLSDFAAAPDLLAAVVTALPADPLRGRVRSTRDGRILADCFACGRPLTPKPGRAGRSTLARFSLVITQVLAGEIEALPGHAPAWGIIPVAPQLPSA